MVAGHSVSSYALNFGKNVGVIGIRDEVSDAIRCSLGENLRSYSKPEGINNVNDLFNEDGKKSLLRSVKKMESEGIEVIALACTGISSIGIDKYLNEISNIPVIDPVFAEAIAINSVCEFNYRFKNRYNLYLKRIANVL